MKTKYFSFSSLLFLVAALVFSSPALAHRVNVFAWAQGGKVFVESKFPGGKNVFEGGLEVRDSSGKVLLTGQTDKKGEFVFEIPKSDDLTIVLDASMGHQATWTLPKEEVAAALGQAAPAPPSPGPESDADTKLQGTPLKQGPPGDFSALDAAHLEALVQKAVDRSLDQRLPPLLRMAAESKQKKTGLADVFAGLGYILGLVGLGAYVHFRNRVKEMDKE